MNTYECWVRIEVDGATRDIKTLIRAMSPYDAEQLLKAQYGPNSVLGLLMIPS